MKLNWLNKIVFLSNIILAIGLGFANLSANFDPETHTFGYIWGMTYPAFLFLNIAFMAYWMYSKKIHFLLSLALILLGYANARNLISINFKNSSNKVAEFSVMSFNVRLFNEYEWLENKEVKNNIFNHIEKMNPDIIAIQEFFESKESPKANIKRFKELGYNYYVKEGNKVHSKKTSFFGLAIFSKQKIREHGIAFRRNDQSKSISYFADIEIGNKLIRIYNTHLNSLGFQSEDYAFVENIGQNNEEETIRKSKTILSKIMIAARKRQEEVKGIKTHISKSPYPAIVLGDFNEPPYSYAYPQFTETLLDPFQKFGLGLGTTFDGISTIPGLRLDYVLHSNKLEAIQYIIGPKKLSDHRPIYTEFIFTE